jgi:hypothetical protein
MAIAYRDALKTILDEYPENIEVSVLYADAMMQVNARDWYFINKKPKTGTLEIVEQLENIIEKALIILLRSTTMCTWRKPQMNPRRPLMKQTN